MVRNTSFRLDSWPWHGDGYIELIHDRGSVVTFNVSYFTLPGMAPVLIRPRSSSLSLGRAFPEQGIGTGIIPTSMFFLSSRMGLIDLPLRVSNKSLLTSRLSQKE
jgi:hypothetical protein